MQYHRSIEERAPAPRRLVVENRAGELVVVGEDRDDVLITAQVTVDAEDERAGRSRLDAVRLPITGARESLTIGPADLPRDDPPLVQVLRHLGITHGTRIALRVAVPREVEVRAVQRAGSLRVTGLRATVEADVYAGAAHLADLKGNVRISTRLGSANLEGVEGDVQIESRAGRVNAERILGGLRVTARRGTVSIRSADGAVDVDARGGRVVLEDIGGPARVRTRAGGVEWRGKVHAPVDLESRAGSLRMAVTPDSAFWVDAEARAGSVRSDLPVDYLRKPDAGAPTVRLRAHAGTIRIVAV